MPSARQRTGFDIERGAARFLESKGLEQFASNFSSRFGELDLIMWHNETLVVVEVRHRGTNSLVGALESVSVTKRQRIVQATRRLIAKHPALQQHSIRFDVVAVDGDPNKPHFHWLQDAFRPW
ncbi:MAG: YraN family protein [Pseudomonadota bacterium]